MRGKLIRWAPGIKSYAAMAYLGAMKSTRDLAHDFGDVSFQSVATMLKRMGVQLKAGPHISHKMKGRPGTQLGLKRNAATLARMSRAKTIWTPEQKRVRDLCKARFKALVRRLISNKTGHRTHELLGYSSEEFRRHIEAKFEPGMSWTERGSFEVDHIVPVAEFLRRGITDPKIVCALANLQPLTKQANRSKWATYTAVA